MIAIVTETLSCMNPADCAAYGVSLIPLTCLVGEDERAECIPEPTLPPVEGRSAPPTEEAYRALFEELLSTHDGVLCITASRRFSESNRHAGLGALPFGGRVMVIDSGSVAGGLFLLVLRARHMISLGYPMSRIKAELESYKHTLRVSFTAHSTKALMAADRIEGRLPVEDDPTRRPVLRIEKGSIGLTTFAAGDQCIVEDMLTVLIPPAKSGRRAPSHVVIHYDERTTAVEYLLARIRELYPSTTVYERPVTLSLRLNLGHNILGLIAD